MYLSVRLRILTILFFIIPNSIKCSKQIIKNHLHATKTTYNDAFNKLLSNNQLNVYKLPNQCKPKMFYMICRHAIRYPNKNKIVKMQNQINQFRDQLILNKKLSLDQIERFRNWKLRIELDDHNHISETGFLETRELAKKIKMDYPEFFDIDKTNLNLYITYKKRTNETAFAFFNEIYKNKTFRPIIKQHLTFHAECKKLLLDNGIILKNPKVVDDLVSSDMVNKIIAKFADKIGIDPKKFDFKSLKMIYVTCSFEYAIFNDTLWCELFNEEDFLIMEYIIDLQSYLVSGHGRILNKRMACPILVDLIDHFNKSIKAEKLTTSLQFSHSGIFKRIYTMFGLFKEFGSSYCRSSVHCFNEWRSSLILPFLANIKFLLYDCSMNPNSASNSSDYRIMIKIQEQLVKIDGCDNLLCPLNDFMRRYLPDANQCDLNKICKI